MGNGNYEEPISYGGTPNAVNMNPLGVKANKPSIWKYVLGSIVIFSIAVLLAFNI